MFLYIFVNVLKTFRNWFLFLHHVHNFSWITFYFYSLLMKYILFSIVNEMLPFFRFYYPDILKIVNTPVQKKKNPPDL